MACRCSDDKTWATSYGGCSSYARDGPNHAFCREDGAEARCQLACGSCTCPPPPPDDKVDGLSHTVFVVGIIVMMLFFIPVIILYMRKAAHKAADIRRAWKQWSVSRWQNYKKENVIVDQVTTTACGRSHTRRHAQPIL